MSDVNGRLRTFLARGRSRHALLCVDTGTATRVTGRVLNADGTYTNTTSTVYTGAARLKRETAREQVAGDVERPAIRPVLVLPWDATGSGDLRKGDRFTFTASEDPDLVGATVTIVGPENGTTASARRYLVEEVTA